MISGNTSITIKVAQPDRPKAFTYDFDVATAFH
jgi:hypothetical protein